MNTEKFKTALDIYLDEIRAFIPTTLDRNWPSDYKSSLQPGQQKKWEKTVDEGKEESELIDFGNLEGFAKAHPTFWRPYWGPDGEGLQAAMKAIRVARNEVLHNTSAVTEQIVADAFDKMQQLLEKIGKKDSATKVKNLKDAWIMANTEEKHRMKLVWRKNLSLQSATLFLRVAYDERREDMQQFLQATPPRSRLFEGAMANMIAERVEKYLQSLKLLDDAGQLTEGGKTVAQTGMYSVKEEGKYQIWYCNNDELLGHRILYLERAKAVTEQNAKAQHALLPFQTKQPHYWLSSKNAEDGKVIELLSMGNESLDETLVEQGKGQARLSLRWEWDGSDRAVLHVEAGGTDRGKDSAEFRKQAIRLPLDLHRWLGALFPKWNFAEQRLPVAFDDKVSEDSRRTFSMNGRFAVKGFESIEGNNIPLMPGSLGDAQLWCNWLVEKELEKDYVTAQGFAGIISSIQSKAAFSSFQLDNTTASTFLITQFNGRGAATRGAAYWHLAAGMDLHPQT